MTTPSPRQPARPHVILIMCDQWRPDCLGVLGHPLVRTPHLDALAARGVLFENAYCASPVCSPARASWLTGLYPHAHGQYVNYGEKAGFPCELRPECVTLGDSFKSAGYRCGIVGPWHLGHDHVPQHGFEESWLTCNYQGPGRPDRLKEYFAAAGVPNLYDKSVRRGMKLPSTAEKMVYTVLSDPRQQRTTWTVDRGCEFVAAAAADPRPFFLFLSVKDPHPPVVAPPELLALYPRERMPRPEPWANPDGTLPAYHERARERLPADVSSENFQDLVAHYFAVLTHIDREVGRLVAALERAGLRDDTVIAFISDHGEMLGAKGFVGKRRFYEPAVRVPCIVSWPRGVPGGRRVRTPLGGVDLAPTLLGLAGVPAPERIDGRNLAPALRAGREPLAAAVFAELATQEVHFGQTPDRAGLGGHVMVRHEDWKYIWSRFDRDELYHLPDDPDERRNLAADPGQSRRLRELRELIRAMLRHTGPGVYQWCVDRADQG
ncbi:MAG: sulfatase-like hydrolase/transferase [Opitutaceae bacterium]|nr:sulfatase-like hydrolase/transferase [Opitutaceae bacterium]